MLAIRSTVIKLVPAIGTTLLLVAHLMSRQAKNYGHERCFLPILGSKFLKSIIVWLHNPIVLDHFQFSTCCVGSIAYEDNPGLRMGNRRCIGPDEIGDSEASFVLLV